jgi:iron complex outermembrane receptor protein
MKCINILLFAFVSVQVYSQANDTLQPYNLPSVIVTSYKEKPLKETSVMVTALDVDSLIRFGNFNLTDLISKTPGFSMLSTGPAIVKPVIRGLYGNRILILLAGLKFDNQQWQEEHGLGLSDIGLSKVELIKGPMSVLYGSEAIGGIINILDEEKPDPGMKHTDISMRFHSNTLGGLLQVGSKANKGSHWYGFRLGIESHADYSDGNFDRVLNSRFNGLALKLNYGFKGKNWTSSNHFLSSFNQFGFIFNDIYEFVRSDSRWSRNLSDNPAHFVLLNILSSENKFFLKNDARLTLNVGVQSNERLENEGGGYISLNMHLLTIQYLAKWEKQLSSRNKIILSNLGSFEDNTNFGARKIVPDANMQESNISAYLETTLRHGFILENGIGAGEKWIKTFFTAGVNDPDRELHPFSKFSPYYNVFSGITYFPNDQFNFKLNVATGVRIANLAELSSNGLHEGVFTYEIGDPDLKNEQDISINLFSNYQQGTFGIEVSPFYNFIYNYIYLTPTSEDWFGFPIFRYKQQNASQYGTELALTIKPVKPLQFRATYSGMISKTEDGKYTPFNPAQKLTPEVHYTLNSVKRHPVDLSTTLEYVFAQDHTAPNEIATPEYTLWNLALSTTLHKNKSSYTFSLAGNNLLNTAYYDHLSRFKYFNLLNMGRNFAINVNMSFNDPLKNK